MHFSDKTKEILNNFSSINQSIVFNPGKTIKTMNNTKTIIGISDVDTEFEHKFGIYDLGQFLSVLSLFSEPSFTVLDKSMSITENDKKMSYTFAEPSLIMQAPEKINFPDPVISVDISLDVFKDVMKGANMISSPEVAITGDGENIYFEAINTKNISDNNYRNKIGSTSNEFRMIFKVDNIKLLPRTFKVDITDKGISRFSAEDVTYYIAVDASSTWKG